MSTLKVEEIQHISNSNNAVSIASDSSVSLKHSGSARLATTSTGVNITGACAATSFSGDGSALTGLSSGVSSDAQFNTVAGTNAGDAFDGTNAVKNTVVGYNAGTEISTGLDNVMVGYNAGATSTSAQYNTALGSEALKSATYAWNNVAVGWQSLYNVVGSSKNTALGTKAGYSLISNQGNTYIGWQAGYAHTGSNSTIIGYDAGKAATSGDEVTLVGYQAGMNNTTPSSITGLGAGSLKSNTTGVNNVGLGAYAGWNTTTGGNNISIGYFSEPSSATASNQVTLGNASVTNLRCADTSISSLSDRRDKTDIVDLPVGLDFVNSLKPRQFKWQTREGVPSKDGTVRAGFIAQELQEVQTGAEYLDLVMDENPDKLEATQGHLMPVLVKAIQELSAKVTALEAG